MKKLLCMAALLCGLSAGARAQTGGYAATGVKLVLSSTGTCQVVAIASHTTTELMLSTADAYTAIWVQNYETSANIYLSWNSAEVSTKTATSCCIKLAGSSPVGADATIPVPARAKLYAQCDATNATCRLASCRMR